MIQGESVTSYYLPLPLTFREDGGADLTIRKGELVNGEFVTKDSILFNISPAELSAVLDTAPDATMTRRDDLVNQIYAYVISTGRITGIVL